MRGIAASFLGVAPFVVEFFAAMSLADVDFEAAIFEAVFFDAVFFGAAIVRAEGIVITFAGATFFVSADFCVAVVVAEGFLAGDRVEVILGEVII